MYKIADCLSFTCVINSTLGGYFEKPFHGVYLSLCENESFKGLSFAFIHHSIACTIVSSIVKNNSKLILLLAFRHNVTKFLRLYKSKVRISKVHSKLMNDTPKFKRYCKYIKLKTR